MKSTEEIEFADALRDLMSEVRRTLDGRPLSREAKKELVRRAVASFNKLAPAWDGLADHPMLAQAPDAVRELGDEARRLLSGMSGALGQQMFAAVGQWLGEDPLADEFASAKIPIMTQCRRWIELSSAIAGPDPEPRVGAVRHRVVSVGAVSSRITLMYGDTREDYDADAALLRRALVLQSELWVVATTMQTRSGARLLALRTEPEFASWQAEVAAREFDPARLALEERDVLEGFAAYDRERA